MSFMSQSLNQGRKFTMASAVNALQLADVPLKIYPYSRPMWPVPSHPPGRGAHLGSSEKLIISDMMSKSKLNQNKIIYMYLFASV